MPGRPFRLAIAALALWLAMPAGAVAAATPAEARPNVVLILADDLGYGDLGAYGNEVIRTPNIDRLAREGVRLTNFFASANVCTPSRAGLLTGRYAVRAGLAVDVIRPTSTYGLRRGESTIADVLRSAGYRTAMLGKWHLGSIDDAWPTEHGFDSFWGVPYSNDMDPALFRGKTIIEAKLNQERFAERLVEEAARIIAEPSERPFFLYVAHIAPHVPLRPGAAFRGRSRAGPYGDAVEELDWTTGRIMEALRASGKDRNTIVFVTSDNGPWWEGSSGARRGGKGTTWEGGYAVPMIARWPGHIRGRAVSDGIAMNIDLLPTIARLAGARLPPDVVLDGLDIWPLLLGQRQSPHSHLLFFNNADVAAVRSQDWRLVVRSYYLTYDVPLDRYGQTLLFRVADDPAERYSLAEGQPKVRQELEGVLSKARADFAGIEQYRTDPFAKGPIQLPKGSEPAEH